MSLEKNFCTSPWFHMRITNSGTYEYCRWRTKSEGVNRVDFTRNIKNQLPSEFFQQDMNSIRHELLDGRAPAGCNDCYKMEEHQMISGRQRQLLKAGIQEQFFIPSMLSSPLRKDLDYSHNNQGSTTRLASDWQIDLGNYCNGACIYCSEEFSSRLATEFKRIGLINETPTSSWCENPVLLDRFIRDLVTHNNLEFLHFIGGETLITPGFEKILQAVVDSDLAKNITIGFTTNLMSWPEKTIKLLEQFKQVHLGASIETLTPVNEMLSRWTALSDRLGWLIQIRTTPTCLTIGEITSLYEYAWQQNLSVESCNFLDRPKFLRIGVLPKEYRNQVRKKLVEWVDSHPIDDQALVINTRDPNQSKAQLIQNARSYIDFLDNADDESFRLSDLVEYLKKLELSRGNSILDYLPHYEQLLRSAGY